MHEYKRPGKTSTHTVCDHWEHPAGDAGHPSSSTAPQDGGSVRVQIWYKVLMVLCTLKKHCYVPDVVLKVTETEKHDFSGFRVT